MAFFRKWKTHYKHKKFTSDEAIDSEDWGLKKPEKNHLNTDNVKLNLNTSEIESVENDDDSKSLFTSYKIKYLGCTPIESKRSDKVVSEAIKTVIGNSKAGGRKSKCQKRVTVNVSQDGIEILDAATQDSLMRFSIQKILYCSVDTAYDQAFSFVGSETDPLSEKEKLSCHVFLCPKRKMAHEITLMVARCFEHAYQHWRDSLVQHTPTQGPNDVVDKSGDATSIVLNKHNVEVRHHHNYSADERKADNLLIDLATTDSDVRKFFQTTWISFDDDSRDGQSIAAY